MCPELIFSFFKTTTSCFTHPKLRWIGQEGLPSFLPSFLPSAMLRFLIIVLLGSAVPERAVGQSCLYGLEICTELQADTPPTSDELCPLPGCFRYYYHVSIIANNTQGYISFHSLDIMANLLVSGTAQVSYINAGATLACLDGMFSDYLVTPTATELGFHIPHQSLAYYFPTGEQLLFTIVVDAFPGDFVNLSISGTIDYGGTSICANMEIQDCQNCSCENPFLVEFPAPDECPEFCVNIVDPGGSPYNSGPVAVPVVLATGTTSTNFSIEEMDVAVGMVFNNFMEVPVIVPGILSANDVIVKSDGSGGYVIYAHALDVQFQTGSQSGDVTLFSISMDGPVFQSSGGKANFNLINARVQSESNECCRPCLGGDVEISFSGFADCTADVTARVDASVVQSGGCEELSLNVTLNWTDPGPPAASRDFYKLNVVLEFDMSGDIAIAGLGSDNIGCPTSGATFCGGSTCFEQLSSNRIRYCFWKVSTPETVVNETGFQVLFEADGGCLNGVTFIEAYVDETGGGPSAACVPLLYIDEGDFPLCSPMLSGIIERDNGLNVPGGHAIAITSANCNYNLSQGNCQDAYAQCVCKPEITYTVTPAKDDGLLCGVTTLDLVMINRHILDVEPFTSDYQLVAADVNKSGTVTGADLIQIRQLILLIIEEFPNNTSWRFADKATGVFGNIQIEESITTVPATNSDFVAVKIGDVNQSCTGCPNLTEESTEERAYPSSHISVPATAVKAGGLVTLPFHHAGEVPWLAFQAGIRFDTEVLEMIGPSKGGLDYLTAENFGTERTGGGIVRVLWFSPDGQTPLAVPGTELFNLTFRAKKELADLGSHVFFDDTALASLAYDRDDREYPLELLAGTGGPAEDARQGSITASCRPNPFSQELAFEITSPKPCPKASLWVFDAFGKRLAYMEAPLAEGANVLTIDGASSLPQGLLTWQVRSPYGNVGGTLVKE